MEVEANDVSDKMGSPGYITKLLSKAGISQGVRRLRESTGSTPQKAKSARAFLDQGGLNDISTTLTAKIEEARRLVVLLGFFHNWANFC